MWSGIDIEFIAHQPDYSNSKYFERNVNRFHFVNESMFHAIPQQ